MKKAAYLFMLLWLYALVAAGQNFELYYAKNVSDVTHFTDNVDELAKQLDWRKIENGAVDGNQVEVNQVKEMLRSTRMKGLEDQQQFWRMRDHTLLCFRINDGRGITGTYNVEVNYGKDANGNPITKSLTTSKYFFANMPKEAGDIEIKVWNVEKKDDIIKFRYSVYDWDDANVYLFQLDQKRQSTGDTYRMEYTTSYTDEEGSQQTKSQILELKETKFQSFYLNKGESLTDMFFLTGNSTEGDKKMRMNLKDIHAGIDMDWRLNVPKLTTTFVLDKHENREMVNFNWLGTGLFEKYDTLFIKLYNQLGDIVDNATLNVHRIDDQRKKVSDAKVCSLGYDEDRQQYRVLTYGHPAYIEILTDDYLPTLYHYKGAADATSRVFNDDLCSAKLTLRDADTGAGDIAISDQHLRYLKDLHIVVARGGTDYTLCDVSDINLASKLPVDTVCFMDNAGNDYPKLYENKSISRYGQLEVQFSSPKGGQHPTCVLKTKELKTHQEHQAANQETVVVAASEFTRFSRDYFFVRLPLVDLLPYNAVCSLELTTDKARYDQFPRMLNVHIDPDEAKKEQEKKTEEQSNPKADKDKIADANTEGGLGFQYPATFKWDLGPFKMKTGFNIDVLKQTFNFFISGAVSSSLNEDDDDDSMTSKARKNAKYLANYNYSTFKGENGTKADLTFTDAKLKFDDWVLKESASIFDVSATHIGLYWGGGFKFSLLSPLNNVSHTQIQEASVFVEGGYGLAWALGKGEKGSKLDDVHYALSLIGLAPDVGAVLDANVKLEAGLKTFDKDAQEVMSAQNMGLFSNLTFSIRAGAWLGIQTPQTCIGGLKLGFRAGTKALAQGGLAATLDAEYAAMGTRFMAMGIVDLYIQLRALFFHFDKHVFGRVGKEWYYPDDGSNPFHKDFPYWIPKKKERLRTVGESYRTLRAPEASSLGTPLITDVAMNANPHFIDTQHVVYNNLGNAADYNDDHISLYNMDSKTVQRLSPADAPAASQHMRSKRGNAEVVVYQQMTQTVNSDEITADNAVTKNNEFLKHSCIKASFRQSDGQWKVTDVTPDDGYVVQQPVVTIQEDGKAACIYQRGQMELIDKTKPNDAMSYRLMGEVQLRTYDGTAWSEPTSLFVVDEDNQPSKYDLMMRNDSVLIGMNMTNVDCDISGFIYVSKALNDPKLNIMEEPLRVRNFFMNRVGKSAVVAMVYERPDSTRSVYVKTVGMNGEGDGRSGCDLELTQHTPDRVKIICDRANDNTNDFAVLWTETNNVIRDAAEGNSANKYMGTVLNASRIRLSSAPTVTYPLTVGAENDTLFLADYDGFLDDDRISVVYSLGDPKTGAAVIMHNEKYFTNGFESDVTYTREALMGSSLLPVNVTIRNIGTSAINSASVNINGTDMAIADAYVPPMQQKVFTVQYPIPDGFDGYMQSQVSVTYDNIFKARHQRARRGAPARNLLRQSAPAYTEHLCVGDIDCNVVSRKIEEGGVNTFIIELIDRSSRGLIPGTAVQVGIYPHVSAKEPLTSEAQIVVLPEQFHQQGAVRKAYAKISVSGITEPVSGYIAPKVIDQTLCQLGSEDVNMATTRHAAPYVNLFPSADPTMIVRPTIDQASEGHRVGVKEVEGGVRLTNLQAGDEVRLFSADGLPVYIKTASGSELFVPLKSQRGVYLLSAGGEVFKFKY